MMLYPSFHQPPLFSTILLFLFSYSCSVHTLCSIVVGGRHFWLSVLAGGPPNMYIVAYIHRVYKFYIRYVHSIYSGSPAKAKSQKWRPPTTVEQRVWTEHEYEKRNNKIVEKRRGWWNEEYNVIEVSSVSACYQLQYRSLGQGTHLDSSSKSDGLIIGKCVL